MVISNNDNRYIYLMVISYNVKKIGIMNGYK